MSYFPESDSHNKSKTKVELDLFNHTKKSNLNEESGIYTSEFARKSDLANWKSNVNKVDIDKLRIVPLIWAS